MIGATAAVLLGCWMNFGGVSKARKLVGTLVVLVSAGAVTLSAPTFAGVAGALVGHGISFFLGVFLLYWGGWFLYSKAGGD